MNKLKLFAIFFTLLFSACAASPSNPGSYKTTDVASLPESTRAGSGGGRSEGIVQNAANAPASVPKDVDEAANAQQQPTARKIIRNADLTLEVSSPEEAQQKVSAITESKGGFVVESTQSTTNSKATTHDRVTMTLRIPAEKFNETLDEIKKSSGRVLVETVKGQDVTEEFVDIEARLKTKKELEARFLEILKQANTIAETLNVQTELSRVRGEIEQIEGRKRFLESQASLSTIKLVLQTPTVFSANSSGFFYQIGQSLNNGFEAALGFVLGFITVVIALIPFFVLVVLPIYLLLRYFWRKYKKRRLANKLAEEQKTE